MCVYVYPYSLKYKKIKLPLMEESVWQMENVSLYSPTPRLG